MSALTPENAVLTSPSSSATLRPPAPERLASMDAFRGLVMFLLMAGMLSTTRVAASLPDSSFWSFVARQQTHVAWVGCVLHDLIQPAFSFLVGVALPYSIASRMARGQSRSQMTLHALWRALLLILLGVALQSSFTKATNWTFEDTLSQIGLGYGFLFVLGFRPVRDQWIAFSVLLFGYWAAFALYRLPGPEFNYAVTGVAQDWPHLMRGFEAHWNKNSNLAWAFDTWFLNLFPRETAFTHNRGGYATLSFIPTLATMILGLIAGGILRSERQPAQKLKWFLIAGVIALATGHLLGALGVCPVVKRIWTPTWTLYSGGWCLLLLAAFYAIVDMRQRRAWAFPLIVIGMNSIAAYVIARLWAGFLKRFLQVNLGPTGLFDLFGAAYVPFLLGASVLLVLWLILLWMYLRKLFLKI